MDSLVQLLYAGGGTNRNSAVEILKQFSASKGESIPWPEIPTSSKNTPY
jgi:hypothetical protein